MLQISNFTTTQTILSDPISIADGYEYAAAISDKGSAIYDNTNNGQPVVGVTLSVVQANDPNTVVWSGYNFGSVQLPATGSSAHTDHGYSAFTTFVAPDQSVRLKIIVTPIVDNNNNPLPSSVDLGYAQVYRSHDFGIAATSLSQNSLPVQLRNLQSMYSGKSVYGQAAGFTVLNGQVVQGTGVTPQNQLHFGYSSNPLFFQGIGTFRVDRVSTEVNGMDTTNLEARNGSNGTVVWSTFKGAIDRISNRTNLFSAIHLAGFTGTADVENNGIIGVPDVGIEYDWGSYSLPPQNSLIIRSNNISQNAIVADAYGILIAGAQNFEVAANHVDNFLAPMRGRGILLDGWGRVATNNGTIHGNSINVYENTYLEYGPGDLEVTAFRIRNNGDCGPPPSGPGNEMRNLDIYNNHFEAHTDGSPANAPYSPHDAMGARLTEYNPTCTPWNNNNADISFRNNVVIAYAANAQGTSWNNANVHAQAFTTAGIDAGTGYRITSNVFESDDTSLNLGEMTNSQYGQPAKDISFFGNTLSHATFYGTQWTPQSYAGIIAGAFGAVFDPMHKVRILNTRLQNGATATVNKPWDDFGSISQSQFNNDLNGITVRWETPLFPDATGPSLTFGVGLDQIVYFLDPFSSQCGLVTFHRWRPGLVGRSRQCDK
jgi:hypothetical protein